MTKIIKFKQLEEQEGTICPLCDLVTAYIDAIANSESEEELYSILSELTNEAFACGMQEGFDDGFEVAYDIGYQQSLKDTVQNHVELIEEIQEDIDDKVACGCSECCDDCEE
ncbi:hypothetical protein [Cytobacillus gottheilii]|uniref:hypothetical protein n=1 Tax=Cytobacillus gottheilii TaxID=859144 RepID=UPI0009BB5DE9|nr:hypothetical protein [Cytobacillus gottheilii]